MPGKSISPGKRSQKPVMRRGQRLLLQTGQTVCAWLAENAIPSLAMAVFVHCRQRVWQISGIALKYGHIFLMAVRGIFL
jgi:hypothetical protein